MVPAFFVIGDSLQFSLRNVTSSLTGLPAPAATVAFALEDAQSRSAVAGASGSMSQYDAVNASYRATIDSIKTTIANGVVPNREYDLRATINNAGTLTTKTARLRALLDASSE